jgi:hypothetical protein
MVIGMSGFLAILDRTHGGLTTILVLPERRALRPLNHDTPGRTTPMAIGHVGVRRAAAALAATTLALTLIGCADSVEETSGDYCSDVDTLQSEVASLESLVASDATLDEIDAQREAVSDAYDATTGSAGDLDEAVTSAAESAYGDFQDAVSAIPGDATLSEAAEQYAAASRAYTSSLETIAADAGCGDSA